MWRCGVVTWPSVGPFLARSQRVLLSDQVVVPFSTSERRGLTVLLAMP